MNKRKVGALILSMAIATTLLSGCDLDNENENKILTETKQAATMETTQAVEEQKKVEKKKFAAGQHVFFKRYYSNGEYSEKILGGQIVIPEGYEILDIENFTEKWGYGSQTGGFDVWFINNQEVEVSPVYNTNLEAYDYSEPGKVTAPAVTEEAPTLKLTP